MKNLHTRRLTPLLSLTVLLACCAACSGPLTPTPRPVTPSPAPLPTSFSGHVSATNGGSVAGVQVSTATLSSTVDGSGGFQLAAVPGTRVTLLGMGIVPRSTRLTDHMAVFGPGFDLSFYRQFARNGFDQPAHLEPIRHWTEAPLIYLRTVRDDGVAIDALTLDRVAATIIDTAAIWSGGRFGVRGLEQGTGTKVGQTGWITVTWPKLDDPIITGNVCGRAQVGTDGGYLALAYKKTTPTVNCSCGAIQTYPAIIRHELGHAFGFWHTDRPTDVMFPQVQSCDQQPSAREREYAGYVYSRPVGNVDPDEDR